MSTDNTTPRDPDLDAKMLEGIRTSPKRSLGGSFLLLTDEELDLLLAIADERDALRDLFEPYLERRVLTPTPAERKPVPMTEAETADLVTYFEDAARAEAESRPIAATPAERAAKDPSGLPAYRSADRFVGCPPNDGGVPEPNLRPTATDSLAHVGTPHPAVEPSVEAPETWPCWICGSRIRRRPGVIELGRPIYEHIGAVDHGRVFNHDAVRGPDPVDRECASCHLRIVPVKAGVHGVAWLNDPTGDDELTSCDHHPMTKDRLTGDQGPRPLLVCENPACTTGIFRSESSAHRCPQCGKFGFVIHEPKTEETCRHCGERIVSMRGEGKVWMHQVSGRSVGNHSAEPKA